MMDYNKKKQKERKMVVDQYRIYWRNNPVVMKMLDTYEKCGKYSVESESKQENVKTYSSKYKK